MLTPGIEPGTQWWKASALPAELTRQPADHGCLLSTINYTPCKTFWQISAKFMASFGTLSEMSFIKKLYYMIVSAIFFVSHDEKHIQKIDLT